MPMQRVTVDEEPESWDAVRAQLEELPPQSEIWVPPDSLPHPREAGAASSIGLPRGQRADWRFAPADDCSGLHVHEMDDGFAAHLDRVHPDCGLFSHLQADAPEVLLMAGPAVGLGLGLLVGRPGLFTVLGLMASAFVVFGMGE